MNATLMAPAGDQSKISLVLLTNFVPPYLLPLFQALQSTLGQFKILVSAGMEGNRPWKVDFDGLPVEIQQCITLRRRWKHPHGFSESVFLHLPVDTLWRLRQNRPHVVVSTEFGFRTLQALLYRKLNPASRLIVWAPVSDISEKGRGRIRNTLRRMIVPQVDAFLTNGESGARYLGRMGVRQQSIFRVPYTTNNDPFCRVSLERGEPAARRLLFVGQLVERKGLLPFIAVVRRWCLTHPDRKVELWFVGDGPLRLAIEAQIRPENLILRFLGGVSYRELPDVYAKGGILVFPTLADEWGVVVNEALAAGLPVLGSSYSQAVEELVTDCETGWKFRPDRENEVIEALNRALLSPVGELNDMRRRCRQRIHSVTPKAAATMICKAIGFVTQVDRGCPTNLQGPCDYVPKN